MFSSGIDKWNFSIFVWSKKITKWCPAYFINNLFSFRFKKLQNKTKNYDFPKTCIYFFCRKSLKNCSFLACLIFFHPILKILTLPKDDEWTWFLSTQPAYFFVLGQKSWKSRNRFSNALQHASTLNLKLCLIIMMIMMMMTMVDYDDDYEDCLRSWIWWQ